MSPLWGPEWLTVPHFLWCDVSFSVGHESGSWPVMGCDGHFPVTTHTHSFWLIRYFVWVISSFLVVQSFLWRLLALEGLGWGRTTCPASRNVYVLQQSTYFTMYIEYLLWVNFKEHIASEKRIKTTSKKQTKTSFSITNIFFLLPPLFWRFTLLQYYIIIAVLYIHYYW